MSRIDDIRERVAQGRVAIGLGTTCFALPQLLDDVEWLMATTERVRAVHEPIDALNVRYGQKQKVCTGCGTDDGNWQVWPCPTIRAMEHP